MNQYKAQYKRERESKSQWIKRKHTYMFRGSSTQLYVPAFTQKDYQSTNLSTQDSHTGNLYWGFGAIQQRSTQLLSQLQTQPLHLEARNKATNINLTNEG